MVASLSAATPHVGSPPPRRSPPDSAADLITPAAAAEIYSRCMDRLRLPQRFPQPDWSIADLWIAKDLLARCIPASQVCAILRLVSPGFPRRHSDPEDYLRRTLARATREMPTWSEPQK